MNFDRFSGGMRRLPTMAATIALDTAGGQGGGGDGSGDSGSPANNSAGNSGDSPTPSDGGDNPGQSFDPTSFWNEPAADADTSVAPATGDQQTQQSPTASVGAQIAQGIREAALPPVFTQEIGEQLAEGNMEGANESFQNMGREVLNQSAVNTARLMQAYGEHLMGDVRRMIADSLGGEKNNSALMEAFPSMADPAMAPVISGVFAQAMKHSKNDRAAALDLTRSMLKAMGKTGQSDFGIDVPAPNADDSQGTGPQDLVADLLGRN